MLKVLNLMVIGSLRSLKCVKPNYRGVWKVLVVGFKKWKVLVFNQNQCTVPEIITILQDSTNSMRNLHQVTL